MNEITYFEHEKQLTKLELKIKRVWVLAILLFFAFVGSNALWIVYRFMLEG